jgi:lantibiotic modifying enzyme
MYREIVNRWFSDCTVAAEVVKKNDVAFVSQLRLESVESESGISDFYYRFGILTALLHGFGSMDMHFENIISCGDRPAVIDIETLIAPSLEGQMKNKQLEPSAHALGQTVYRIGILPVRMYRKPLVSPLYSKQSGTTCLPIFGGKTYTVEGYEDRFVAGFREGYYRLLAHRAEIKELLRGCGGATVRCLMRNTMFYSLIQKSLYSPDALKTEADRERILRRLSLPFEQIGIEVFQEEVAFEAACLRIGDIPYFCTTLDGTDLCGDDPRQVLKAGYFSDSPQAMTEKSLDRLSEAELRYEEDIIRTAFAHAPLDEPKEQEDMPIAGSMVDIENARTMAFGLFHSLQADAIRLPEGGRLWLSNSGLLQGFRPCGLMTAYAEAGAFCAVLARSEAFAEIHAEAIETARECVQAIAKNIKDIMENAQVDKEEQVSRPPLSLGLYNGYGGVVWGLAAMESVNVPLAHETVMRLLRLLTRYRDDWHWDTTVAEGLAGLMLGLDALPGSFQERDLCARLCAEKLLAADIPAIPDAPKGAAGLAMALAAAYGMFKDARCAKKASAILLQVRDAYDDNLHGWPDSQVKIRWMAGRGTQAAGIALAADYVAKRLPEQDAAKALRETALLSLLDEKNLGRFDTMDQGNALTVQCFLRTGRIERAGQVLEAMRRRAEREGNYIVTSSGIRSFFDPALWLGSLGVGYTAAEYLRVLDQEGGE